MNPKGLKFMLHFNRFCSVFIALIFSATIAFAQQNHTSLLSEARKELPKAFENEKDCTTLYNKLIQVKNPEPILKGYVGASSIAMARHASLFDKRGYLKPGIELLEKAIKEKPNNTELLFIRLTIQLNLPSFLGYNDNIDSDKKFVLANYQNTPQVMRERISKFIKDSEHFTPEEKASIK
jgi:hypothetical protein